MSLSIPSVRSPLSSIAAIGLVCLTACAQTTAEQSEVQLTYETYTLDGSTPTIPLTGDLAVWGIENLGPSSVFIRTAADPFLNAEVAPSPEEEAVTLFAGDQRYRYTLGLGEGGTAANVRIRQ